MKFGALMNFPKSLSICRYLFGSTTGLSGVPDGAIIGVTHLKTFPYLEVCKRGKLGFFNPPLMRLIGVVYFAKFSITCIFFVI